VTISSALFRARPGVFHGFTHRLGTDGQSLDLSRGADALTWSRAATAVGAEGCSLAFASQVHGAGVLWVEGPGFAGEGDAMITRTPNLILAIRVADCVPIIVAGTGVVAVIHAGWRGLVAGVIETCIGQMEGAGPLVASVGPRICSDCYEVGSEVVAGISESVPPAVFVRNGRPKPHVDLGAAAAHQLCAAGVSEVEVLSECTRCDPRFWSHRAEGSAAGRQAGLAGLRC
jgi:YfiH family protein